MHSAPQRAGGDSDAPALPSKSVPGASADPSAIVRYLSLPSRLLPCWRVQIPASTSTLQSSTSQCGKGKESSRFSWSITFPFLFPPTAYCLLRRQLVCRRIGDARRHIAIAGSYRLFYCVGLLGSALIWKIVASRSGGRGVHPVKILSWRGYAPTP